MEFFKDAGAVCLRSHHGKYLIAKGDKLSVSQSENGSADCAKWTVEHVSSNSLRLESCYGKYLTASAEKFILGATGRKVIQSRPRKLDSSVEWKPINEGGGLKLQSASGRFLRANEGPPPYRNSVTHDVPLRSSSQDLIVWGVEILETKPLDGPSSFAKPCGPTKPLDGTSCFTKPSGPTKPLDGTSCFTRPSGPTSRPGNTSQQQVKRPSGGNSAIQAVLYASAAANMVDVALDMTNNGESTDQIPTAESQPGNGEEGAVEQWEDEDEAFDGEEDVACEEDDGGIVESLIDTFGSIFQG